MFAIFLFFVYFCLFVGFLGESSSKNTDKSFDRFYGAVKEALATEPETATVTGAIASEALLQAVRQREENPLTLRQLRDLVRERQLQSAIRERLGKSVSECRKEELLTVLFA
jgi:predicted RNA binding protein with dsRBD fold (UPF0201 family)